MELYNKRQIVISVVKEVGLEVVLCLPTGEEVAVIKKNLPWRLSNGRITLTVRSVRDLKEEYGILCRLIRQGGNALLPVKLAGKGSSENSKKVQVSSVLYQTPYGEKEHREHTLTVPVSQIVERDSQFYAPRWLVRKTIHNRVLSGKAWPKAIPGGVWFGGDALWKAVFEPVENEIVAEIAERESLAKRQKKEATRRKARLRLEAVARAATRAAEVEKSRQEQARMEAKKAARMASLENINVERVEWDEWVSVKNEYGSKSHKKVTRTLKNCKLFFSGQRVYVQLEDGSQIIKTRETVRWGEAIGKTQEEK